jgi:Spy/CpxP family protein refolding chaperone
MNPSTRSQNPRGKGSRLAAAGLAVLALAATAAAAQPRHHDFGRGHHLRGPASLARYLELDAKQSAALEDLLADLAETTRPVREEQRALRQRLDAALAVPAPDPATVGDLVVELRANREQLRAAREKGIEAFAAQLTPEQAQKLAALRDWKEARRGGRGGHRARAW